MKMLFDSRLPKMKPTKLIVLNKKLTVDDIRYKRLPKIYFKLLRKVEAYYYYSDVVIEIVGKDVLIRKAILQDYVNVSRKYTDYRANKNILVDIEPIRFKQVNSSMLDLMVKERTYKEVSKEGKELLSLLNNIDIDTTMNNSSILREMLENNEIELGLYSNTLMSEVKWKDNGKSYNFYEFMNVLNLRVINKR